MNSSRKSIFAGKVLMLLVFLLSVICVCQIPVANAAGPYSITASAPANGTISPSGTVTVSEGSSQSYAIAPVAGYLISDVQVDGVSVGAVTSYKFTNVTANHTIAASMVADTSSSIGPFAYISNTNDNTVSVIDTSKNSSIGTIPVGNAPYGVAVNAAGTYAYVTNHADNSVSVIDTSSNNVVATISVGSAPYGVAVNSAGSYVYVANQGDNTVSVIDTSSNSVVGTISVGTAPYGVAMDSMGFYVYVTNHGDNTVSVIDPSSNSVLITISVGSAPYGVAVNSMGTYVYVVNKAENAVSVIDTSIFGEVARITVGNAPYGVAVNPAGTYVYVANQGDNTVSVIDTSSNTVVATISVGNNPSGTAVDFAGTYVYVANQGDNTVSVIETSSNSLIATMPVGASPAALGSFIGGSISNYSLTVSAGANGGISPSGTITIAKGDNQTFSITPDIGYWVEDVQIDGISVGAVYTYTFSNVTANHTIAATFVIDAPTPHTITASAGPGGSISCNPTTVDQNQDSICTITPDAGYVINNVIVDNASMGPRTSYTFLKVKKDHTITASFSPTIVSSSSGNGIISPLGTKTVLAGNNQTYTMTPNAGYYIANVTVDGSLVPGTPSSYTFTNVTVPHTISVTFAAIPTYTVTPGVSGNGGTISPSTPQTVNQGSTISFTVTPDANYSIASVSGCGGTLSGNTYTTAAITANCSVTATFAPNTFTITPNSGTGGSISCNPTTVNAGGSSSCTITPNACYSLTGVQVDGVSVGSVTSYTFSNVTANHTISATFALNNYTITASESGSGNVSPLGNTALACGSSQTYRITPTAGYSVANVQVDGVSVGSVTSYTFNNVTANHSIQVTFSDVVKIAGANPRYFSSLQSAYNAAVDGDIIQSYATTFTENLNINRPISVTLAGGYNNDYSSNTGATSSLKGMLQTYSGGGTITVKNFVITQ